MAERHPAVRSSDVASVGRFRTRVQAQKAKHILDQAGVESLIRRDPIILDRLQDPAVKRSSSYDDHVQLMVRGEDVEKALDVLQPARRRA